MINRLSNAINRNRSAAKISKVMSSSFNPPALKQTDALWELFSPKIGTFVKTAVLTLEIYILTMTMVIGQTLCLVHR